MSRIARPSALVVTLLLAAAFALISESQAQTSTARAEARELIVGTKISPPFAMKAEDGSWRGVSIDLWKRC